MTIITITRGLHSGGEELAESLAKKLDARCVSGEVLGDAAKKYNVPETKVSQVFETSPSFWERMTESRRVYLAYIQATLADMAEGDNLVYHGNAGQELLRDVPHVLRVRLLYPLAYRMQRIVDQFGCSQDEAQKMVTQIDQERTRRMEYMFSSDWRDPSRYDLGLRMEKVSREAAEETILALTAHPEFQLDEQKKPRFRDFIIRCRIYALLAGVLVGRLSQVSVTVKDGEVTLEGALTSHEAMVDQLVAEVEKMEGVRQVNNDIVVGLVLHEWNV